MSNGSIFLLPDNQQLVPMLEQGYESEDLLQALLSQYPALLAGEQMDRTAPRRWVLVKREAGVPAAAMAGDQWSMDHLFLDQDGVPTVVEVKKSTNRELRRQVVGQMLDYAANAVRFWPAERIPAMFEETCRLANRDSASELVNLLQVDAENAEDAVAQYWESVERNLRTGRIRMVFVADAIPPELQTIVEFLNEQMRPAEVLAVEVRQYVGQGAKTLVPRVFGLTSEAMSQKGPNAQATAVRITEADFLSQITDDAYREGLRDFFARCREMGIRDQWGAVGVSLKAPSPYRREPLTIAWVYPPGRSGWSGIQDLNLGFDPWSAEQLKGAEGILEEYWQSVQQLPSAEPQHLGNLILRQFEFDLTSSCRLRPRSLRH